jgi:hypothetical protein
MKKDKDMNKKKPNGNCIYSTFLLVSSFYPRYNQSQSIQIQLYLP